MLVTTELRIPTIKLRSYQEAFWKSLEDGATRGMAVWHRRAGKDEVGLNWVCDRAHRRKGNYLYLLPEQEHVRRAIWESINPHTGTRRLEEAFPSAICGKWKEADMIIPLKCGSHIRFSGSDTYNALMGGGYIGIGFSEWALADPLAWAYLKPIVEENGGWALFLTTPRGENHAHTMWTKMQGVKGWAHSRLTVADTDVYTAEQLASIRFEYEGLYGEEEGAAIFAQEMYCDWSAPISGAFYAAQLRAMRTDTPPRIGRVPYDRRFLVDTTWDIGYGDATAIWFIQRVGGEVRFIDYFEARQKDIPDYAAVLKSKPYQYRTHYMPPDADARTLAGRGVSVKEQLEMLNIKPISIGVTAPYIHQIQATRSMLGASWIDETHCERGIAALQHYHAKYRPNDKDYSPVPAHDWSSHGATSLATYALEWAPPKAAPSRWYKGIEATGGMDAGWMR